MSEGQPVFADPRLHDGSTSTGELASRLAEQVSRLARDEIGLAQRQLAQKGRQARLGAGAFGVAAVAAFYAGGALLVAAGLALSYVVAGWAAAVIVGVVLLLIAGIAALVGRSALRRVTPIPTESIESVRADLQTVKESVRK
jgi:VIT1/CCC1 family predicted Fe2+/Mn2+ transporter